MATNNTNTVIISGNLTRDPELKSTGSGLSVCEIRLASNSSFKKDGKWESRPHFFQVNAWGAQAENLAKHLQKGSRIIVQGRLEYQEWKNEETGKSNSRVVIVANQVEFINKIKQAENDGAADDIPF